MTWLSEYEVADLVERANRGEWVHTRPHLTDAIFTLARLVLWTNGNSDGWAYWPKPGRASSRLQQRIVDWDRDYRRSDPDDLTRAELTKLYTPIKAFLTRQGVDHDLIIHTDRKGL